MDEKKNCPPEDAERAGERRLERTVIFLEIVDLIQSAAIIGMVLKIRTIVGILSDFSGIINDLSSRIGFLTEVADKLNHIICGLCELIQ